MRVVKSSAFQFQIVPLCSMVLTPRNVYCIGLELPSHIVKQLSSSVKTSVNECNGTLTQNMYNTQQESLLYISYNSTYLGQP